MVDSHGLAELERLQFFFQPRTAEEAKERARVQAAEITMTDTKGSSE